MFGIDLRGNVVPSGVGEGARPPEENHGPTLVADDSGVIGALFVERPQLGHHVVDAPEVWRLEVNGRREAGTAGDIQQMAEVRVRALAIAVPVRGEAVYP